MANEQQKPQHAQKQVKEQTSDTVANKRVMRAKSFWLGHEPAEDFGALGHGSATSLHQFDPRRLDTRPVERQAPERQARGGGHMATRHGDVPMRWVQPKLRINAPGDQLEQEADRVAGEVVRRTEEAAQLAASPNAAGTRDARHMIASAGHEPTHPAQPYTRQPVRVGARISTGSNAMASGAEAASQPAAAPPSVERVIASSGQALPAETRERMEEQFGEDFGDVRIHTGAAAAGSAEDIGARAYTAGQNIVFGAGELRPGTADGDRLLAHELAHVVQQGASSGTRQPDAAHRPISNMRSPGTTFRKPASKSTGRSARIAHTIQRQDKDHPPKAAHGFPWVGEISASWNVALHEGPHSRKVLADLPTKIRLTALEISGSWLKVSVYYNSAILIGYISQELVQYVGATILTNRSLSLSTDSIDIGAAFLVLKEAETGVTSKAGVMSDDQKARIMKARNILLATRKYSVDATTYRVSFSRTTGNEVTTIEDFILFVETVERTYPSATPAQVATEIRQLWYSDANWDVLVAGQGIVTGKGDDRQYVDMETEGPIPRMFDMGKLAPKAGGKLISTKLGIVEIGHVISGIEATLTMAPAKYPEQYLEARGNDNSDTELKYKTLTKADHGDPRDFATWSGDIGQAYAEYLVSRYINKSPFSLSFFVQNKSSNPELLADIHGYAATTSWNNIPANTKTGDKSSKISNILRDLYLTTNFGNPGKANYSKDFNTATRQKPEKLQSFIKERSLAFAAPWYAKVAVAAEGKYTVGHMLDGKEGTLDKKLAEFNAMHEKNEKEADKVNKIDSLINKFLAMLSPQ